MSTRWIIERGLQISIEAMLDIGNHIIADERLESPDKLEEIFRILAKENVISKKLADQLEGAAGFRNILVHEYAKIDPKKVYENLQKARPTSSKLSSKKF